MECVERVWNISPKGWGIASHSIFLHLIVERLPVYGKQLRRLALVASRRIQGGLDALALRTLIVQCRWRIQSRSGLYLNMTHALLQFLHAYSAARGKERGTLHHVVEFSQVARPGVGDYQLSCLVVEPLNLPIELLVGVLYEEIGEEEDVGSISL